jgi:methionyl-tRNA formyltransferase
MRIACVGYRHWALEIYDQLASKTDHVFLIFRSKAQYKEEVLYDFKPDLVLFYGWSWRVPEAIVNNWPCIMLHPSPLPKFRGGSPIQNQIISGCTESAVTLFLIDKGIDTGPIIGQAPFSLQGSLQEVFHRITCIGFDLTRHILDDGMEPVQQNEEEATVYSRRSPEQSEITINELENKTSEYIFNKIRMLQWPYPNAYFKTSDGKKLLILSAKIEV